MPLNIENARCAIRDYINAEKMEYIAISDAIWNYAETGLQETKSSRLLASKLEEGGFHVEFGTGGMPTAFTATYGHGHPVIVLVAEYDALFALSQKKGVAKRDPIEEGRNGHGCGHNCMGTSIIAAALAAKSYLEKENIPGTIRVIGTPAEETIGSKTYMVRDGIFDDVDACIGYHSAAYNAIQSYHCIAGKTVRYHFTGKAAHAGAAPHLGRSALDACELMNVGVNYLREHVKTDVRMHYCYDDAGGKSPNVVPASACLRYNLRATTAEDLNDVTDRVRDIANGAALMTGTVCNIETIMAVSDLVINKVLGEICTEAMMLMGEPDFDDEDEMIAQKFFDTLSDTEKDAGLLRIKFSYPDGEKFRGIPLIREVAPFVPNDGCITGGTDLGDVSHVVPTAHFLTTTYANGTPGHSWQQTAQTATSIAHKGLIFAAKSMALAILMLLDSPEKVEAAKKELFETTGGKYRSPLPPDQKPKVF